MSRAATFILLFCLTFNSFSGVVIMDTYIAFLRGINVSGQKIIKMEALRDAFLREGFTGVKTYIQSGNVLFNSTGLSGSELPNRLEGLIVENFGFHTDVILRSRNEIESVLKALEIIYSEREGEQKLYISFLKNAFSGNISLPLFSKHGDVEIIYHNTRDFISLSHLHKGTYGFPNAFIEKFTGIPATTRNPQTLRKILDL